MTQKTDGIYHDGLSSKPQAIEVFFDKTKSCFQFINQDNKSIRWNLTEVLFAKVGQKLSIKLKENTLQNITINDVNFIQNINDFRTKNGHVLWYEKIIKLGLKTHAIIAVSLLAFVVVFYIYVIPFVAEKSVVLIPEEYDTKLGDLFFEQSTLFEDVDVEKTKALNLFANNLELKNTKKLKFTVINSSTVNAFALPDGNIVVYTGILNAMQNYDELVGLIGHEASHVNKRHSMKMICRNLSGYIFVSVVLGDANAVMAAIGDNVNTLQSLSYSRTFEHEADVDGFQILVNNNINPKGMSNLFKRLQAEENDLSIPEFLSSHPVTNDRIAFIDKMIKDKSFTINENSKLKDLFNQLKE
jgi:beta-barrel assembly-enhancing protease